MGLKVVAISDTHGGHQAVTVPDADVLVHTGDYCKYGRMGEVKEFAKWLKQLPHKHKIVIAGNHDKPVENRTEEARQIFQAAGVILLVNELVDIDGVRFWGSPITPKFFQWHFMKSRGQEIAEVWAKIPDDVDVLLTHGPPYGHGDLCPPYQTSHRKVAGCLDLLNRIREIQRTSHAYHPKVHVFGHIHAGHGVTESDQFPGIKFVNASICTEQYQPTNAPIVFEVHK